MQVDSMFEPSGIPPVICRWKRFHIPLTVCSVTEQRYPMDRHSNYDRLQTPHISTIHYIIEAPVYVCTWSDPFLPNSYTH